MGLSRKTAERLVKLTDENETLCYRDIHKAFPTWSNEFLYGQLLDSFVPDSPTAFDPEINLMNEGALITWVQRPANYKRGYVFQPDDLFELTKEGSDIRYEVEKEFRQECLAIATLVCSLLAALLTLYPLIVRG